MELFEMITWNQANDGSGSGLDADLIDANKILMFDGKEWVLVDNPPMQVNIGTILALTDPNFQEGIVKIMLNSFTDPKHIEMFIERHSPNEELKQLRYTIWQMLR